MAMQSRAFDGRTILTLVPVALLVFCAVDGARSAEPAPTVEIVEAAWKARAERVRSFAFEWDEYELRPKGSPVLGAGIVDAKKRPVMPNDVSLTARCRFVLDGQRAILSEKRGIWSGRENEIVQQRSIMAFCDDELRILFAAVVSRPYPFGSITPKTALDEHSSRSRLLADKGVSPLAQCFRILDRDYKVFAVKDMQLGPLGEDGDRIVATFAHGEGSVELELSARRDYVPTHFKCCVQPGITAVEKTIDYIKDEKHGWIPSEWTFQMYSGTGALAMAVQGKITKYEINRAWPKLEFELKYPPGTHVYERPNGPEFIVAPDGSMRPVDPNEKKAPRNPLSHRSAYTPLAS